MKLKESISPCASGRITIYRIINNERIKIATSKNSILPNAIYLLARLLMFDGAAKITNLRVFNGSSLLNAGIITSTNYLNPNEVEYTAVFNNASFSGAFTRLALGPSDNVTYGDFSEVTGLTLTKAGTETIAIVWNIKLDFCSGSGSVGSGGGIIAIDPGGADLADETGNPIEAD